MAFVTMSSKGQLVIPASMRQELGLEAGDRLEVRVDNATIVITPVPDLDELSARVSEYARRAQVKPVASVDEYYQSHRASQP